MPLRSLSSALIRLRDSEGSMIRSSRRTSPASSAPEPSASSTENASDRTLRAGVLSLPAKALHTAVVRLATCRRPGGGGTHSWADSSSRSTDPSLRSATFALLATRRSLRMCTRVWPTRTRPSQALRKTMAIVESWQKRKRVSKTMVPVNGAELVSVSRRGLSRPRAAADVELYACLGR